VRADTFLRPDRAKNWHFLVSFPRTRFTNRNTLLTKMQRFVSRHRANPSVCRLQYLRTVPTKLSSAPSLCSHLRQYFSQPLRLAKVCQVRWRPIRVDRIPCCRFRRARGPPTLHSRSNNHIHAQEVKMLLCLTVQSLIRSILACPIL
jgi:hypothetical protein